MTHRHVAGEHGRGRSIAPELAREPQGVAHQAAAEAVALDLVCDRECDLGLAMAVRLNGGVADDLVGARAGPAPYGDDARVAGQRGEERASGMRAAEESTSA